MKIFTFLLLCLALTSCASVHSNKMSYAQSERLEWQDKAEAGDAEAQFQMGNSWCCDENNGFFSTKEAVRWWCKAAEQGHSGAKSQISQKATSKDCP